MTYVKICGLSDPDTVRFADGCRADFIGFVFVEASPRAVTPDAAANLLLQVRNAVPVALVSDADDALIDAVAATGIRILQLHGSETDARAAEIKARTGCDIWKAIGVGVEGDLEAARRYTSVDCLLLDAKPPTGAAHTGGHGAVFDWTILKHWSAPKPWMLAGGLTPENVAEAIAATGARGVDVSTGVERSRGLKDKAKIEAFIEAAKKATSE